VDATAAAVQAAYASAAALYGGMGTSYDASAFAYTPAAPVPPLPPPQQFPPFPPLPPLPPHLAMLPQALLLPPGLPQLDFGAAASAAAAMGLHFVPRFGS
jgi:hypothetical protein